MTQCLAELGFALMEDKTAAECADIAAHAPDPWSEDDLRRAVQDVNHLNLVGMVQGKPVGFASFLALEDLADLQMVAVLPEYWRQGVAKSLLEYSFAALKGRGVRRCLLELRVGNLAALALYKGLGFKELARRPGMYSAPPEDGFLMALALARGDGDE